MISLPKIPYVQWIYLVLANIKDLACFFAWNKRQGSGREARKAAKTCLHIQQTYKRWAGTSSANLHMLSKPTHSANQQTSSWNTFSNPTNVELKHVQQNYKRWAETVQQTYTFSMSKSNVQTQANLFLCNWPTDGKENYASKCKKKVICKKIWARCLSTQKETRSVWKRQTGLN